MINANMLKGHIVTNGLTVKKIAKIIGIDAATLYRKINGQSDFYCHEIIDICRILNIKDPIPIFFADKLTKTQERDELKVCFKKQNRL
jgi:predicted transcriptional regulator